MSRVKSFKIPRALTLIASVALELFIYRYSCPTVSLYQLDRFPDWYDGTNVRLEATAIAAYQGFYVRETVSATHCPAAVVAFEDSYEPSAEVAALIEQSATCEFKAKIIVVGRFDQDYTMGCFGPRFGIIAKHIEIASPIVTVKTLPKLNEQE